MKRSSSSMPHMRLTSAIPRFRIRFTKSQERVSARLSSAAFPRTADSRVCVVDSRSCRNVFRLERKNGNKSALHPLWHRRWSTKANSVSYPVQRGAEAIYSPEGKQQVQGLIDHYMGNARILREAAGRAGLRVFGGANAPYIWVRDAGWCDELADVRSNAA